jgi:predicted peptidase
MGSFAYEYVKYIHRWFVHAANDNVIGVEETDLLVKALENEGNADVQYTRYDHSDAACAQPWMVGHNCWNEGYTQISLWKWLFSKRLKCA